MKNLGRQGRDSTPANTPTIVSIKIDRPHFKFQGLPKLTLMKMINPCNDLSLFNADVTICLFRVFCQSGGARPSMIDVGCVLINHLIY